MTSDHPPHSDPEPTPASSSVFVAPRGPWGPWATVGFAVLIVVGFLFGMIIAAIVVTAGLMLTEPGLSPAELGERMVVNDLFFSLTTWFSFVVVLTLVCGFVVLRKGPTIRDYLALRIPGAGEAVVWTLGFFAFVLVSGALMSLFREAEMQEFMKDIYLTAELIPLLALAVVVAAPISEEILFRGFVFRGLRESRLGASGTILFTAAAFGSLHSQYDVVGMIYIFAFGAFLGLCRERTGSVILCIGLHALMNAAAMLAVASTLSSST